MGRDRTSTTKIGKFELAIDKDHLGYYRGKQAYIESKFRGWHYHIEHETFSQDNIMDLLEKVLNDIGAVQSFPKNLGIGVVEYKPKRVSCWELERKTCVLWTSGFNGKLHVETNKNEPYKKGILTKNALLLILKKLDNA